MNRYSHMLGRLAFGVVLALSATVCAAAVARPALDPDFEALVREKGEAARTLILHPTLDRVAKIDGLPCTASDFEFLLDRPRASVALAGRLHKSLDRYDIQVTGPGLYHIDDQKELVGDMEVISMGHGKRLYYLTGYWKLVLGVKLRGSMALVVEYADRAPGQKMTDAKARGYMLVDSSVAGAALKLLVNLFPKKVDARINRFATSVVKVVEGLHDDPSGTLTRLEKSPRVPAEEVREFRERFGGGV